MAASGSTQHNIVTRLRGLPSAAISDALDRAGIPGAVSGLLPLSNNFRTVGPAYTVRYASADGSAGGTVGDFLDDVPPGAVIVIDNDSRADVTVWGGIMTEIAAARGIAGTVINGVCRDVSASLGQNYPLFSRGRFMRTGKDRVRVAAIAEPVTVSGIEIRPGALVCADADGVVAVPAAEAERITETAEHIERIEAGIVAAARGHHPARGSRELRLPHPADQAAMTDEAASCDSRTMKENDTPAASHVIYKQVDLTVSGVGLKVATASRDGDLTPVLFLHGFGSTKEDYTDIACQPAFTGRPFLAYDAPGCGQTWCEDLSGISIPFLVQTAQAVLDQAGIRRFHLAGHSMGGLTALLLAHKEPGRVLSFTDIEGNLTPEDCFLSRQILTHPSDDDDGFLDNVVERARRSASSSGALFAASLRHKVRPSAVRGIFRSMIDLSDHGNLLPKFLTLPCPRMFMYGDENARLSYLAKLAAAGVELAEIPHSGHWPMYANPVAMWERIAAFIHQSQAS
jgi:regulator of RNase E activity RraA/pimeloyl-ACP methyl ester carboxylesterase